MKVGSLFTGYGGLDMAVESVFGARTVWTSDIDPGACKIIAHRYPDAPNHGDITAMDWTAAEPIDVLTGGWPCQPFSNAGKRLGADDDRALWPEVVRAVRTLRPRFVVLENVSAIATVRTGPELARAAAGLAALGYMGSWRCIRASDVGAPHRRERIFIVATDTRGETRGQRPGLRESEPGGIGRGRLGDSNGEGALLPTPTARDHKGHNQQRDNTCLTGALLPTPTATQYGNNQSLSPGAAVRPSLDGLAPLLPTPRATRGGSSTETTYLLPTPRATDGTKGGPNQHGSSGDLMLPSAVVQRFGQYADAIARWQPIIGRTAPNPTTNGRLSPRFVEWMMGLPAGWVTDVPNLRRAEQLKALGNGVVPQQAAAALTHMINMEAAA